MSDQGQYQFQMLTPERWADFEKLLGKSGAFWRMLVPVVV